MTDAMEVVETMCARYSDAVSANDSAAYKALFASDAIRVPPGSLPEHGPDQIAAGEQADYDVERYTCRSRPLDAVKIDEDHIFGLAEAAVTTERHDTGSTRSFTATKSWLIERQATGQWLIKRQMWNLR